MRVKSTQNISGTQKSKKTSRKSSSQFSLPDTAQAASTSASSGAGLVAGIDALLALQAVDLVDPREQRKQAISHAEDVLDILEKLKVSLLSGRISREQMTILLRLLERRPAYDQDPQLNDLLDHIDMRAKIELAKHNMI
ncbi:MAG: flagellar assembly protein FliX [Pseudomonadota bacterium]